MKIELTLTAKDWWIERADIAREPDVTCRAHVRFESDSELEFGKKAEVSKEAYFETLDEAAAWVKELIGGGSES